MNEDHILSRVAVEQVLRRLAPADRCMMLLVFEIEFPDDWGDRPMTYAAIGDYIGRRFEGRVLSEAGIRYRRNEIMKMLRGERGEVRRPRRSQRDEKSE
jgi:hypothetical protein